VSVAIFDDEPVLVHAAQGLRACLLLLNAPRKRPYPILPTTAFNWEKRISNPQPMFHPQTGQPCPQACNRIIHVKKESSICRTHNSNIP
jgi:hypothetical protein